MKVETDCYQTIDKEVKAQTSAGVIYVPKAWVGKKVRVLLLDPVEHPSEE
jgi:putative transposon-encoded protein